MADRRYTLHGCACGDAWCAGCGDADIRRDDGTFPSLIRTVARCSCATPAPNFRVATCSRCGKPLR